MEFVWHETKRQANRRKYSLDFADAALVFAGPTLTYEDTRDRYGEQRFNTTGLLGTSVVVITHTEAEDTIRIISMRKALCARRRTMKSKTSSPTSKPRLRVGLKDVSREEFAAAVGERMGTEQVAIRLDASVIAFFKAKAGNQSYEALINQALHRAMDDEHIEHTLRRVVREELASHRDDRRD